MPGLILSLGTSLLLMVFTAPSVEAQGRKPLFSVATIPSVLSSYGQAYAVDADLLYNVSSFNVVAVVDPKTNRYLRLIDLSSSKAVLSSGLGIASGKLYVEAYPDIVVVDLASERVLTTLEQPVVIGSTYGDISVSPDEQRVYAVIGSSDVVTVIDSRDDSIVGTIPVGPDHNSLALSPDARRLYVTNKEESTLSIIDTVDLAVRRTVKVSPDANFANFPLQIAVARDEMVYINFIHNKTGGHVAVFSPDGDRLEDLDLSRTSTGIAVSPGGDWLVTGGGDIISRNTGKIMENLSIPTNGISTVLFAPTDGRSFITNMNHRCLSTASGFQSTGWTDRN